MFDLADELMADGNQSSEGLSSDAVSHFLVLCGGFEPLARPT
jgi:hypothetical protein